MVVKIIAQTFLASLVWIHKRPCRYGRVYSFCTSGSCQGKPHGGLGWVMLVADMALAEELMHLLLWNWLHQVLTLILVIFWFLPLLLLAALYAEVLSFVIRICIMFSLTLMKMLIYLLIDLLQKIDVCLFGAFYIFSGLSRIAS